MLDPASIHLVPLAARPELAPAVQAWFEAEWPGHYGPDGPGDAAADLRAYTRARGLPMGWVALVDAQARGFAALKTEPFAGHPAPGPWVGAALVQPAWRGRGIGAVLISGLEKAARAGGIAQLHSATATSARLLERLGWQRIDTVMHAGTPTDIYRKTL